MERTGYHPLISASFAQCRNRRPQTRSVVFSNGGFLHSVPAGSFFFAGSQPPKTLLLKETFSQLQFIIGTGVSVTKQIRHMQYGKSPLTTDVLRLQRIRTKAALSNHRISLKTSRRFSPRCSPTRRHFQNRPLTKNRQPKHIFNGSRDTSLFRRSPARRHFQNRPLTKNRQLKHIFNGTHRRFSLHRNPARRHFQNRPLTKNRQPKHIFNGSRDTSLFRCSPTRRHFQNRPLTKNRQPKHIFNGSRNTSLFRCSPTRRHFQNRPLTKNRQPEHIFNGSRRHFSLPLRIRPLARQTNTHQDKRSTPSVSFHEKSDKENPSLPGGGFRPLHGRKPSSSSL